MNLTLPVFSPVLSPSPQDCFLASLLHRHASKISKYIVKQIVTIIRAIKSPVETDLNSCQSIQHFIMLLSKLKGNLL